MEIDPVVLLAEDLRTTDAALERATQLYSKELRAEDGEAVKFLLNRMMELYHASYETIPTSALGAGELVRMAARRLPFSFSRYASHLHEIADRLSLGRRIHTDLVWLRALEAALAEGVCGKVGDSIVPWLTLAVIGASRPILVFRSVQAVNGNPAWQNILAPLEAVQGQEAQMPSR